MKQFNETSARRLDASLEMPGMEDIFRSSFLFTSSSSVVPSVYIHFTTLIFVPQTKTANTVTLKIRAKEFRNMRKIYTSV